MGHPSWDAFVHHGMVCSRLRACAPLFGGRVGSGGGGQRSGVGRDTELRLVAIVRAGEPALDDACKRSCLRAHGHAARARPVVGHLCTAASRATGEPSGGATAFVSECRRRRMEARRSPASAGRSRGTLESRRRTHSRWRSCRCHTRILESQQRRSSTTKPSHRGNVEPRRRTPAFELVDPALNRDLNRALDR